MPNSGQHMLETFLKNLIEGMRPKLLDLTRRNPLLSTPFSERSHSNLRVVDEVPTFLFEKLLTERMRLIPLPSLEEDPKDEQSEEFKNEYALARYSDEEYLRKISELEAEQEDSDQIQLVLERELKDRVRAKLGMPDRQTSLNTSLQQHAKNHQINPSYDLIYDLKEDVEKHVDNDIQTLLLPEQFERRLNAILSKVRMWQQETGISVFHIAFGFLEWTDTNSTKSSYAPLILMPAILEKERTPAGVEFYISSEGENPEENVVLSEKLRLDYAIDLPKFDKEFSIDKYLSNIEEALPLHLKWRVRKQVALGVFPSAKMAMYHDLNTGHWNFFDNEAIKTLFTGTETGNVSIFADDYDVDEKHIESKVPFLIADADSSQFSTIVDITDNKNLAVEGPPGSGKSQTIVNTIASALYDGKKILFVAEKTAALEVVKSRLEALNLGEFVLPLLASRGSRASIIQSLKDRVELGGYYVDNIKNLRSSYVRSRNQLQEYINILGSEYGQTELTVHEILGKRLKHEIYIKSLPNEIRHFSIPSIESYTNESIEEIYKICEELEEADLEYADNSNRWEISNVVSLTPFAVDEILTTMAQCADKYQENNKLRDELVKYKIDKELNDGLIIEFIKIIELYKEKYNSNIANIILKITKNNSLEILEKFIGNVIRCKNFKSKLEKIIDNPEKIDSINTINKLIELSDKYKTEKLSNQQLQLIKSSKIKNLNETKYIYDFISQLIENQPLFKDKSPYKLIELCYTASLATHESLAFRDKEFENPLFHTHIENQCKLAESVKLKKNVLNKLFYLDRELRIEEIRNHLDNIISAGFFKILNSKYRAAKKYYKLISKDHNYSYDEAIKNLEQLIDYLLKGKEFNSDDKLQKLFKYNYKGIDTDFSVAIDTLKYYKNVEDNFSSSEDVNLRNFLLQESVDKIRALPKPDLGNCQNVSNYGDISILKNKLDELLSISNYIDSDIEEFNVLIKSLKIDEISNDELKNTYKQLVEFHNFLKRLDDKYIHNLLGSLNKKIDTNEEYLNQLIEFYKLLDEYDNDKSLLDIFINGKESDAHLLLNNIKQSDIESLKKIEELAEKLKCNSVKILNFITKRNIASWANEAKFDKNGLLNYSKLSAYIKAVSEYGFKNVVELLIQNKDRFIDLKHKINAIILANLAESIYKKYGTQLSRFNGLKLNKLRQELANKDKEIQELASYHIAEQLVQNADPPNGIGTGPKRTWTQYNLINNEISKKRQYISPRDLTHRAGRALLELKPCWMMSPLSVAQYIRKGDIEFDLLIIDEASQMTPENSIGAISRCKQAMIVGDTNQLPPTSFFKKFIAVDEEDDDGAVTEESILEIANNAFRPARRLRWHYRSQHSSLIAFSNKHIYDDDLTIYPSAYEDNPTLGVSMVKVDGIYSTGSNPKEASVMVEHIVNFMRQNNDRSLGVVTVNQKQRDLLFEEFEYELSSNPDLLNYINKWEEKNDGLESFFIKNLENVQGDERDVIFIGTVYGPQSPGAKVMQRFGPINGVAGKRRLNVLFTRAKKQIITFSSMTSSDIVADENSNPGVYLLKQWLEYSTTNVLETGIVTNKEPDSAFEEYVIDQIKNMGCIAIPQVGVSGYFVDIGVKHPDWPHGFILGVECDGASYHSSKSARDRDRLREEVLVNLGWEIYRIWSTDWFENPRAETEKLREKIEKRLSVLKELEGEIYTDNINYESEQEKAATAKELIKNDIDKTEDLFYKFYKFDKDDDFLNEDEAKSLLIKLREEEIAEEFESASTERGILNDQVIEVLLVNRPKTPGEFRNFVPLVIREKIDHQQMIYLNTILDIIKRIK